MDFQSLKDQVSNLSLYDIKAGVRKVQNAVMNFTEMEAKVREATNNEPWGASSTLMQEIADGTHSYQLLNEIMPMIYKRFTEKTAEEWRQIYKALQLLEFLIKNGSERVVDDARSHMSLLKMLRQFHYIDKNGKDQGVNVRNRSQELVKLLSDVDQIRAERKKARANRHKFGGFEGGSGFGPGFSSSGRYGGFGSDSASYGGYSGGVFGDGGGFGGNTMDYGDATVARRSTRFEEYDEGDNVSYGAGRSSSSHRRTPTASASGSAAGAAAKKRELEKKAPEPVQDLFDFGDDEPVAAPAVIPAPSTSSVAAGKQPATADLTGGDDDDEFADFQSAPAAPATTTSSSQPLSPTQFSAPQPISTAQLTPSAGLMGMASPTSSTAGIAAPSGTTLNTATASTASALPPLSIPAVPAAAPQQTSTPSGYQPKQPNYFTSTTAPITNRPTVFSNFSSPATEKPSPFNASSSTGGGAGGLTATATGGSTGANTTAAKASGAGKDDVFGSLWSTASASAGIKSNKSAQPQGPKLSSLAKEKATAGIWGAATGGSMAGGSAPATPGASMAMQQGQGQGQGSGQAGQKLGNGLDDLLG
ncbi:ENTH/VHS family protein [Ascosphaera apis ARSEF 7405]|uniref:ENTH/VHS family protein n=1 Tax=Ascosphaera apis ARSEF 7405 TaxID=392613 RepID=A0A162IBX1_9EURO|nr:ENTH/VHS family protein [Ascosphaera apis ARSEF 7405]